MTEEINEESCFLNMGDIEEVECRLLYGCHDSVEREATHQLFIKIKKLNEWYKNTHLEKIEAETDPEFAEVE